MGKERSFREKGAVMKVTSKVLIALGIVAVLIAGGVYYLYTNLDRIVAAAIEKYGSEATGTKVAVSSVRIRLNAGEGSVRSVSVGNPEGFSTPNALLLETVTVALNTASVTRNPVIIDRLLISGPRITYEIDESGRSNIQTIQKRVQTAEEEAEEERYSRKRGRNKAQGEKRIVIKHLVIENGEVTVQAAALPGKPLSVALPRIELRNIGGRGGDSPGMIATQVLAPLVNQAAFAASRTDIGRYIGKGAEEARKAIEEKLAAPGKEAAKGAEDAVRKILGK